MWNSWKQMMKWAEQKYLSHLNQDLKNAEAEQITI